MPPSQVGCPWMRLESVIRRVPDGCEGDAGARRGACKWRTLDGPGASVPDYIRHRPCQSSRCAAACVPAGHLPQPSPTSSSSHFCQRFSITIESWTLMHSIPAANHSTGCPKIEAEAKIHPVFRLDDCTPSSCSPDFIPAGPSQSTALSGKPSSPPGCTPDVNSGGTMMATVNAK